MWPIEDVLPHHVRRRREMHVAAHHVLGKVTGEEYPGCGRQHGRADRGLGRKRSELGADPRDEIAPLHSAQLLAIVEAQGVQDMLRERGIVSDHRVEQRGRNPQTSSRGSERVAKQCAAACMVLEHWPGAL